MYWYRTVNSFNRYGPSYALFERHYQLAYYMVSNYRDFIELDKSLEKATILHLGFECNVKSSGDLLEYGESDKCDFFV